MLEKLAIISKMCLVSALSEFMNKETNICSVRTEVLKVSAKSLIKIKSCPGGVFVHIYLLFFFNSIYFYPIKEATTYNLGHNTKNFIKFGQFYGFFVYQPLLLVSML